MQKNPLVSVIMNCYNSDKFLKESIESVISQSYDHWEIVFWDNKSTDKSAEIARSFKDDRIKYYYSGEHSSLGTARNRALEKCDGKYIAFLDCDDVWVPYKLERQVQLFEKRPDVDFIYGNFYVFDTEKGTHTLRIKTTQPEGEVFGYLLYAYSDSVGILTVMIRKEILDKSDARFDPNLNLTEDYELFMRILYSSKAAYIHDPLAFYRVHPKMSSYVYREKWVEEYKYVNKKFKELDKGNRYSKGIEHRERRLVAIDALIRMARGELRDARLVITPHRFENIKNFIIYIATFLPVSVWFFFRPVWSRGAVIR